MILKKILAVLLGLFALFYLANPGAGVLEIIPDNLPLVGNLDEAFATMLLLIVMTYFGIEPRTLMGREWRARDSKQRKIKDLDQKPM